MFFHKIIATGLGIGYIGKGAGTIAAIVTCICWWLFQTDYTNPYLWPLLVTIVLLILGIMSAGYVEEIWGKDNQKVVIDEVAGMWITLLFTPLRWDYIAIGFIFFRFFDIMKPLYIRQMEQLPGGWGVMADDVLAGIYSNILLQAVLLLNYYRWLPF